VLVFSVLSYDCWSQLVRIRMPALLTCSMADALHEGAVSATVGLTAAASAVAVVAFHPW
jgi:hypothetical protein